MGKIVINTEDLVSIPQAAKILGRPKVTLYRWIKDGKVPAIELSGVIFIQTKDLKWIKERDQNG